MSRPAVRSFAVSALAAVLLLSGLPPGTARPAAAYTVNPATVFINEIHYDNAGADAGEFVEVAGPAGTDLTGWQLVPYNGSGGASYTPAPLLSGVIPDQQNGYGTLFFPIVGLQNGAPDGIALVNGSMLIQFLSYEGTFTATNGPANGVTSTDIGVLETGGTTEPPGLSLQLQGTGNTYQEFIWSTPRDDSPGAVNTDQTFAGGAEDAAPAVSSTDPADNDTNVSVDTDISITFSEPVAVTSGWYSIGCTASGTHTAAVSGGPTTYTLEPTTNFANGENCTVTIEADNVADQDATDPPDNMAADHSFDFTTVAANPCAGTYTPIYQIQGTQDASPMNGTQDVTTEGVVTRLITNQTGPTGFFLQEPQPDANALTSEGIFVFGSITASQVDVGDAIRLTADVTEFLGMTELEFPGDLFDCGTGSITPTSVTLPEEQNGDLERYEGMLVSITQTLTAQQNFFLGRYGQVTLASGGGRLYTPTNSNDAGSPAAQAQADQNQRRIIVLDDGTTAQNPNPVPYLVEGDPTTDADDTLRAGDTTGGLTGILDFGPINANSAIRDYRIQPTAPVEFARTNPRTSEPEDTGGNVTVASFNVLNYFTTFDQPGAECTGPDPNPRENCRGANDQAEFDRQKAKIVAAISAMDADVVGLMEMQNNGDGPDSALVDLVEALNEEDGAGTWAHISDPAFIGDDAIKVALIYKPASVTPVGDSVSDADPIHDRPPVAQTFDVDASGGRLTVIVNHFKSKGSCPSNSDPDYAGNFDSGDGQGCWNAKRVDQAAALLRFIDGLQTASGDDDVLVIGDLNSYGEEDPIQVLEQDLGDILGDGTGGLIDQLDLRVEGEPYSYIFDGQSGYLDHALATGTMSAQVTDATEWHINADEPSVLDYNTEFKPDDRYTATPYRSSDHDPVLVGLQIDAPANKGPTAVAQAEPTTTEVGLEVDFDGSASSDPDGSIEDYAWDFDGDGITDASGRDAAQASYRYKRAGTYGARLTVTDDDGDTDSDTVTITVRAPDYDFAWVSPTLDPPAKNRFVAGSVAELHFTLGDDYGLDIFKGGWPKHQRFVCGTRYDLIENSQWHTRPFGSAGLTYDAASETYTYHWQTREEWGKPWLSCRQFQIRLRKEEPPTVHHAEVKFVRAQPTS